MYYFCIIVLGDENNFGVSELPKNVSSVNIIETYINNTADTQRNYFIFYFTYVFNIESRHASFYISF